MVHLRAFPLSLEAAGLVKIKAPPFSSFTLKARSCWLVGCTRRPLNSDEGDTVHPYFTGVFELESKIQRSSTGRSPASNLLTAGFHTLYGLFLLEQTPRVCGIWSTCRASSTKGIGYFGGRFEGSDHQSCMTFRDFFLCEVVCFGELMTWGCFPTVCVRLKLRKTSMLPHTIH